MSERTDVFDITIVAMGWLILAKHLFLWSQFYLHPIIPKNFFAIMVAEHKFPVFRHGDRGEWAD